LLFLAVSISGRKHTARRPPSSVPSVPDRREGHQAAGGASGMSFRAIDSHRALRPRFSSASARGSALASNGLSRIATMPSVSTLSVFVVPVSSGTSSWVAVMRRPDRRVSQAKRLS
jgi:hypothetical protein